MSMLLLFLVLQAPVEAHVADLEERVRQLEMDLRIWEERRIIQSQIDAEAHSIKWPEVLYAVAAGLGAVGAGKVGWDQVRKTR